MTDEFQQEVPLPFPGGESDLPLLPARMVNEYQYCPRLAYLEWVQGEWAGNTDTSQGRSVHRRVDKPGGTMPDAGDARADERIHARSITLSSVRLGLIAKTDLIEGQGDMVTPVDYKKGKRPHVERGAYDPERVQLCIQGLLLEESGYRCDEGILYYAASRERVRIGFDDELRQLTRAAVDGLRLIALGGRIPEPLEDSPKCPRCSLVGICLPDEVNYFAREINPRPLAVGRDGPLPVYVQAQKGKVARSGETMEVFIDDRKVNTVRLIDVSQLVLMGNIYVTTPCLMELIRRDIPITWHSHGGWFIGHTFGNGHKNVEIRTAQYRASFDRRACLRIARGLVEAKIRNCRTLLRRNHKEEAAPGSVLRDMKSDIERAARCTDIEQLLGVEGAAAARYFGHFRGMLRCVDDDDLPFDFTLRNRRPPTDPVNALLSFAYAMLTRTWTVTLHATGFDPFRGFYHKPRYGRPALALDLMEPFRPLIADSSVIQVINNGEVRPTDFVRAGRSVALKADGRKRFIAAFERRLSHEIIHPQFGYRVSYRRLLEIQARLLGRYLLGEIPDNPNFTPR